MSTRIHTTTLPGKPGPALRASAAPCEHLLQFYEDESARLDTLGRYVADGLRWGDGVLVIARPSSIAALEQHLRDSGIDLSRVLEEDRYLPVDALRTLDRIMVDGRPDELRFRAVIPTLLARVGIGSRRVRAFAELVGVLWAAGQREATMRLESLWHDLHRSANFSLLCAYPQSGFSQESLDDVMRLRDAHSSVLD